MASAANVRHAKGRRLTWLVVLLAASVLLNYVDRGAIGIAAPVMKEELGFSATEFGTGVSAFFWAYAPLCLVMGWLCDRFCVYRMFAAGLAIWAICTALTGFVSGLAMLIVLRIGLGIGEAVAFPGSSKIFAAQVPPERRGIANASSADEQPVEAPQLERRSNKEPYDLTRPVAPEALAALGQTVVNGTRFGGTVDPEEVATWRALTREALRIEVETPHTYQESVDLFRIGRREVDANPDGIDFSGPMFESMHLTGLFTREIAADPTSFAFGAGMDAVYANADTAMGHVWLVTADNSREKQLATGADWLRVNLAATQLGLGFQPLSQSLQEFPEMAGPYAQVHDRLAPDGGTVQMLARIGYGPMVGNSPRWPLESKILNA